MNQIPAADRSKKLAQTQGQRVAVGVVEIQTRQRYGAPLSEAGIAVGRRFILAIHLRKKLESRAVLPPKEQIGVAQSKIRFGVFRSAILDRAVTSQVEAAVPQAHSAAKFVRRGGFSWLILLF